MSTITTTIIETSEAKREKNPKRVAAGKALAARNKKLLAKMEAFEKAQKSRKKDATTQTDNYFDMRTIETQTYPEMRTIETQTG